MSRIKEITGTSQDICYVFDFRTRKRSAFIDCNSKLIHADLSGKDFEPLLCFPFLEKALNPDRKVEDIILNFQWIGPDKIKMEIYPGLIEAMPKVDPSTITFILKAKEKKQGERVYWGDIGFIMVYASLQENFTTVIQDDKLYIRERPGQDQKTIPDGYSENESKRKKGLKPSDPGFLTDWTESGLRHPGEKETQYQEPKPREKEPGPKTKAKVLYFPLYPTPPKEVLDKCKELYGLGEWKRILRGLHKYSWYRKRNEDKYYPGKSERRNRQYVLGQIWLAKQIGVNRMTARKWLYRFEADGIIYIPYIGYKDRGASIIELAFTESHRRMNKRKIGERKKPLSTRWLP
ncbi:hypothetical protein ES702_07842 [subsurface metagenome]